MTVKFWAFAKRLNSTAQPTASAAYTFDALSLKAESGVLTPVLEIFQSQLWNPSSYNYAQIVEYGRYYFVTEWTWVLGHWECQLECDVLATWKTDIGSSTMYVVRAASEYDAGIVDTLYPTRYGPRVMFHDSVSFGFDQDLSGAGETSTYSGCYVIGIAANSNGVSSYYTGPVTYWVMSAGQCRHFVDYMLLDYNQAWDQAPSALYTARSTTSNHACGSPYLRR